MNRFSNRHEWTYAGETFSTSPDGEIEWAATWNNGAPGWKGIAGKSRIALDACAAEIIKLSLRVDELEAEVERAQELRDR